MSHACTTTNNSKTTKQKRSFESLKHVGFLYKEYIDKYTQIYIQWQTFSKEFFDNDSFILQKEKPALLEILFLTNANQQRHEQERQKQNILEYKRTNFMFYREGGRTHPYSVSPSLLRP